MAAAKLSWQPWPPKLGLPGLVTFKAELSGQAWSKKPGLPGLKDLSQGRWLGFFELPGQKFITLSDCNIKPQNLWPFVVP